MDSKSCLKLLENEFDSQRKCERDGETEKGGTGVAELISLLSIFAKVEVCSRFLFFSFSRKPALPFFWAGIRSMEAAASAHDFK